MIRWKSQPLGIPGYVYLQPKIYDRHFLNVGIATLSILFYQYYELRLDKISYSCFYFNKLNIMYLPKLDRYQIIVNYNTILLEIFSLFSQPPEMSHDRITAFLEVQYKKFRAVTNSSVLITFQFLFDHFKMTKETEKIL